MENQIDLREIAENNGLTYAESTNGGNGYPANIKGIIIGFEYFQDAEKLAEKYGLSIEFFLKKDGWQLWERTNNQAHEPMKNSSEDYGDNYSEHFKMTESEFIKNEVAETLKSIIDDGADFDTIDEFISDRRKLYEEIEKMEEDEIIITCQGEYYDTIKRQSMYFAHDTKHITIGLIDRN